MRPYRLPSGKHLDLDHVLAIDEVTIGITPQFAIHMMFRDQPLYECCGFGDLKKLGATFAKDVDFFHDAAECKRLVWQPLYDAWVAR